MKLSDFNSLAEAQAYEVTTYKGITSNKAAQFFSLTGMINLLEAGLSDTTQIEVIQGMPTTVDNLCKTIIETSSKSGEVFATDPATEDGQLNIAGSALLVANGVYPAALEAAFFALGKTTVKPFENITQEEFDAVKAEGETASTSTDYNGNPFLVTAGKRNIDVECVFDAPLTYDSVITLTVLQKSKEQCVDDFTPSDRAISVRAKAGTQRIETTLNRTYSRHVQITGVVDKVNTPFHINVSAV